MNNDYDLIHAGEEVHTGIEYVIICILILCFGFENIPYIFLGVGLGKFTRGILKLFKG